jgi:small multidrug resistance pump
VAVVGYLWLGESMTWPKAASLALIVAGVVGLNLVQA